VAAEQDYFESRQALGLALGLSIERIISLPIPEELFPPVDAALVPAPAQDGKFVELALRHRPELKSLDLARQVAEIQLAAAQNELRPNLSLTVSGGYSGSEYQEFVGSRYSVFEDNARGFNTAATVNLAWPIANNAAEGTVRQREAALAGSDLNLNERQRQISSEVLVACSALRAAYQQLAETRRAVESYRKALANEEEKRRLGMTTRFTVIQMEDRLVSAMSSEVNAVLQCATAVLRLRTVTGTLASAGENDTFSVALNEILTVPPCN
jgi:outer membrane protein TolC